MSGEMPGTGGHDQIRQSATASGGSWVIQAGGHVNMDGFIWDGPPVPVRPPFERLAQGPAIRGRRGLLEELTGILDDPRAEPRVRVLHGLGGAGKTSVALVAARHAKSRGIPVWWIRGTSAGSVAQGMRSVAIQLGMNPAALSARHPADALWELFDKHAGGWLLVLDDIDTPNEVLGEGNAVTDGTGLLRPVPGGGLVLVTTRDGSAPTWGSQQSNWFRLHRLKPVAPRDGAQILLEVAGAGTGDQHEAGALAVRLGGLPLALQLAGRFLAEARNVPVTWDDGSEIRTFRQYEEALNGPKFSELLGPIDEQAELDEKQARVLVGRTWELSLDLLERQGMPQARSLLRLVCCFTRAPLAYQEILSPELLAQTKLLRDITARQLTRTIDALAGLDLISLSNDNGGRELNVHPLVRDVGRQYVLQQRLNLFTEYFAVVASLIFKAMGGMSTDRDPWEWPCWKALAPHCASALSLADDRGVFVVPADQSWKREELLIPPTIARAFLLTAGRYMELEEVSRTLLRWQRRIFGPLAEETLATEANLAYLCQYRGDYVTAAGTYQKLATLLSQRHPVNPLITSVRHNWAALLRDRGDLDGAEEQYRLVLRARRREFGDEHELTLSVRNCLADIDNRRGNYAEARRAYESLARRCRRVLGPKARLTLTVQDNLAVALQGLGDRDAAEKESRAAVTGFTETLGAKHPDTLVARSRLAMIVAGKGDLASAAADLVNVVQLLEQVLGPQHIITTDIRSSLGKLQTEMSGHRDRQD